MSAARPGKKQHRTLFQRLVITVNIVLIMAALGTAAGVGYLYTKVRDIPRVDLTHVLAPDPGDDGDDGPTESQNFLLVGTDSAEGIDDDDPILDGRPGGIRSDTIMILRVDPEAESASLLSIPRDLWVPIAGTRRSDKINGAIADGPEALIETIDDYFRIPVHHYIQVNWLGFRELVAAVHGVPMYFAYPVRDRHSGLSVPEPGCVTLDPVQALAYARSRYFQVRRNGAWESDGTADLGRMSRQQDFLRRALERAFDRGARSPAVLNQLVDAGLDSVTIDDELTPGDLLALGRRFRNFDPNSLVMYSLPVSLDMLDGVSIVRLQQRAAQATLDIFRGTGNEDLEPKEVEVLVENGTGEPGQAGQVAEDLRHVGFSVPSGNTRDAAEIGERRTIVRYSPGSEVAASLVARYLAAQPVLEAAPDVGTDVVVVVTGADYGGVLREPRPAAATPGSTSTSTTSATASTSTTTTTVVGEVPTTPPDIDC